MIVEDLPKRIYMCNEPDVLFEMMCKEDNEILVNYFNLQQEILFRTDKENLNRLNNNFKILHNQLVNFNLLPMFYELYFYISLKLEDYKSANKYLRSFSFCIEKIKNSNLQVETFIDTLEKNFRGCKLMINLHTPYKENGKKDTLIKFFMSEEFGKIQKEINIRVLMRLMRVKRPTSLNYLKHNND